MSSDPPEWTEEVLGESEEYFGNIVRAISHPVETIEAMAQNANDTYEEEGLTYMVSYVVADIAIGKAAAGKYSKVKAADKTRGVDDTFKKLKADIEDIELPEDTWSKSAINRGKDIDNIMNNNVGQNYPTIDRIDTNGIVTSVKSRDLNCKTYKDGKKLESVLKKDIDKMADFSGRDWNGVNIRNKDIKGRQLQIVVPDTTLSDIQVSAINSAITYAEEKGVKVIITIGREK